MIGLETQRGILEKTIETNMPGKKATYGIFNWGPCVLKIKISEELSTEYDMLRVDLYISDDEIYFGELTNTPDNGYGKFQPQSFDFELGEKWNFQKEFE